MPAKTKRRSTREVKPASIESAGNAQLPVEDGAPFGQAMQSLFTLVGQMRAMIPEGTGASIDPRVILTSSGLEPRVSNTESAGTTESPDRLAEIERSLNLLSARVAKLEEQFGSQNGVVDSLRAAVQQNEEMLETLVDSMNPIDDSGQSGLGLDLMLGPRTLAS
jgi:hypothetical protein